MDHDDIDLLLEAVDAWERKDSQNAFMGTMLAAMLIKDKDEAKRTSDELMQEAKSGEQLRKERAILIKAKLLQMRDKVDAGEFAKGM